MMSANHILAQEGILTTFSISKKVTARDVKELRKKMKSANVDAGKLQQLLKQSVIEDAESSMKKNQIPGLILEGQLPNNNSDDVTVINNNIDKSEEDKRIMELTYFSSLIAKKIVEKKMDKYYACYIINALVNMLGLNDNDFEQFHKQFSKYKNGGKDSAGEDSDNGTVDFL